MKSLIAFTKKEIMEQSRTSKLIILGILFVLFGIMNPAVAKLTPWLIEEVLAESMAESGMTITTAEITALDSWAQFFKNIPMALIAFVLLESSIFTKEYQSGTLVLSLTKGLHRYKVVISKTIVLTTLWSIGFWLCYAITYGYNAYFWDNSVAKNLMFSVLCWYLFGLFVIALMTIFSTLSNSNTGVLLGTGCVVFSSYFIGLLPKVNKYLPTLLMDGNSLIYGKADTDTYTTAIIITVIAIVVLFAISIPIFNKKHL